MSFVSVPGPGIKTLPPPRTLERVTRRWLTTGSGGLEGDRTSLDLLLGCQLKALKSCGMEDWYLVFLVAGGSFGLGVLFACQSLADQVSFMKDTHASLVTPSALAVLEVARGAVVVGDSTVM